MTSSEGFQQRFVIIDGNIVTSIVQIACRIALRAVGRSENLEAEQINSYFFYKLVLI